MTDLYVSNILGLFSLVLNNAIKLAKDLLNQIFQDLFNKILSQQFPTYCDCFHTTIDNESTLPLFIY